jgi:hypothetical protein
VAFLTGFFRWLLLITGLFYSFCGLSLYFAFSSGVDGDGITLFLPPIIMEEEVVTAAFPEIAFQSLTLGILLLAFPLINHLFLRDSK